MEYTTLGTTDIRISRICLGCMGFGDPAQGMHSWTLDEAHSAEIIRYALDSGINFFDTAMAYQGGTSEIYVGKALQTYAKRHDVVIATKFLPRSDEEIAAGISAQQHIESQLNASLQRLNTDYVDLYIYHMWDYRTPAEQIMESLHRAVTAGKVRAIGISNCYAWQLAKANALAEMNGWTKFSSVQGHYNLIFREEEREMIPLCRHDSMAVTPYSALAGGRLAKRPGETSKRLQEDTFAMSKYDKTAAQDSVIIGRVAETADKRGVSMTAVSLAWLLTKATSPIVGATKQSHIDGAVEAAALTLTPDEIARLEEPYLPHALTGVMAQTPR